MNIVFSFVIENGLFAKGAVFLVLLVGWTFVLVLVVLEVVVNPHEVLILELNVEFGEVD